MHRRTLFLSILVAAAATASLAAAQPQPPVTTEIKDGALGATVDREFREALSHGTSGAIVLEANGKIVLKAGYGFANRETHTPFTPQTIAQIGSITKQFTAMALIDLWHRGRIDFSKPVKAYLPAAPEPVASVTLDQLLLHTTGMPDECGDDFDRVSEKDFLTKCASRPLAFKSGSQFRYSNAEYTLLAMIVEKVSGEPLENYLAERFFRPLGMARTGTTFPGVPRAQFASGYLDGKAQAPIDQRIAALNGDFWNLKGNGGMQSTLDDMDRWYHALSDANGLPEPMRKTAIAPRFRRADMPDLMEGYGWAIRVSPDGSVAQVSHSGSDGVFFSYFCWRPKDRTFWYLVGNAGEKPTVALIKAVLKTVTGSSEQPRK